MRRVVDWFRQYGYYYKWHFIIGGFVTFLVVLLIVQTATKTDYDMYMTVMGPEMLSASEVASAVKGTLTDELKLQIQEISVRDIIYVSSGKRQEYLSNNLFYSASQNSDSVKLLDSEIAVGDSYIFIIDREQYSRLTTSGAFTPLAQVLTEVPEEATDAYGIPLMSTGFGKYFPCFASCDEDMILCLRANTSSGAIAALKNKQKEQEKFELHRQVFQQILAFDPE